ncbi:MAG: tetratricopeptide repeat protein, partial [Deltaproteobacteria bacterium]|nr:tetratricopeptide repeat protein [Deltaproteobacteria bacterium]
MALFGRTGDIWTLVLAHENLGFTLYKQGKLGLALAQFNRGLELSADVGDQRGETVGHAFLARVHAMQGDLNRARRHIAAATTKVHALRDNSLRCGVRFSAAVVHLAAGLRDEAIACLEECCTLVRENHLLQEYVASCEYTLAETLLGTSEQFRALSPADRELAVGRARKLLPLADRLVRRFPAHAGPVLRVKGLLALRQGRKSRARALLRRSIERLKAMNMRHELVKAYQVLAEAAGPERLEQVGAETMAHRLALEVGCSGDSLGGRIGAF